MIVFALVPLIATFIYGFIGWLYTLLFDFNTSIDSLFDKEKQKQARIFFLMLSTPFYPKQSILKKYDSFDSLTIKLIGSHYGKKRFYTKWKFYGYIGGDNLSLYQTIELLR